MDPEDSLNVMYGMIYSTFKGSYVLVCAYCAEKYRDYEHFLCHLAKAHIAPKDVRPDILPINTSMKSNGKNMQTYAEAAANNLDIKTEPMDGDAPSSEHEFYTLRRGNGNDVKTFTELSKNIISGTKPESLNLKTKQNDSLSVDFDEALSEEELYVPRGSQPNDLPLSIDNNVENSMESGKKIIQTYAGAAAKSSNIKTEPIDSLTVDGDAPSSEDGLYTLNRGRANDLETCTVFRKNIIHTYPGKKEEDSNIETKHIVDKPLSEDEFPLSSKNHQNFLLLINDRNVNKSRESTGEKIVYTYSIVPAGSSNIGSQRDDSLSVDVDEPMSEDARSTPSRSRPKVASLSKRKNVIEKQENKKVIYKYRRAAAKSPNVGTKQNDPLAVALEAAASKTQKNVKDVNNSTKFNKNISRTYQRAAAKTSDTPTKRIDSLVTDGNLRIRTCKNRPLFEYDLYKPREVKNSTHTQTQAQSKDCPTPLTAKHSIQYSEEEIFTGNFGKETHPEQRVNAWNNQKVKDYVSGITKKERLCLMCPVIFTDVDRFREHMKIHRDLQCQMCSRGFINQYSLKQHIIGNGEKQWCKFTRLPFQCHLCDWVFATFSGLTSHLSKHFDVDRYRCKTCNIRYMYPGKLVNHQRFCPNKKAKIE